MIYLGGFTFPCGDEEFDYILSIKRKCYNTYYPFGVLSEREFLRAEFEPVTIFYGGNGSGKTTALNVIADKLRVKRTTPYNRSDFFEAYTDMCTAFPEREIPKESMIITSDDVFDYMLNIRSINEGIDLKRQELFEDYLDAKYSEFKFKSMEDYERLKKVNQARSKTQSMYVKKNLMANIREQSNGESAYMYFTGKITQNNLYLLDEPENSLSVQRQSELAAFIEESARFFGCQFIIATHSPFLLAVKNAKIYDLDSEGAVKKWTELKAVREYYDFFEKHREELMR